MSLDPFDYISDDVKKQIADGLLTRLAKLTEKVPRASNIFLSLKSDAVLQKSINEGLQRATDRFVREYMAIDEDLVTAISRDTDFWQAPSVRAALLGIIQNPSAILENEQSIVAESFHDVLKDRVNRQRVDKAVTFYLRCVAEALWHLEPFRPVYELQMQRVSAESAGKMIQEIRGMQGDFQQAILALVGTIGEQQKLLTDSGVKALPVRPTVYHNVPQRDFTNFIGREAELNRVLQLLQPYPRSQHAFITIDGIGGIGKSTLALEVANRFIEGYDSLPVDERFDAIIWTSAKERILTADGIRPRYQTHRTLDDIYAAIAITLQREDIPRSQPDQQAELVRNALTRQRTLLIVDNFETIDDEMVLDFIRELPAPTKAIVTTRHRIDVAYAVRLTGMKWEEAEQLIASECKIRAIELTAEQSERLYARTGGVPLAIVLSLAQVAFGYPVERVLHRLGEPQSDIIKFCFDESLERIKGQPAEKLLMALSYCATTGSRDGLGKVAQLSTLDRDDGLVALEKLSLVNKQGDRFALLPVTKVFAVELAGKNKQRFLAYGNRWLRYLETLFSASDEFSADYRLRYGRYLSPEDGPNLIEALDWANEYGKASDIFSMTIVTSDYLDSAGFWHQMARLLERGVELARTSQNRKAFGRLAHSLAWLYEQWGNWDPAKEYYEETLRVYRSVGDRESEAVCLQRYSALFRKIENFTESRRHLDLARTISNDLKLGDLEALIDTEEGKHCRDLQQWDKSWSFFVRVRDYFAQRTEQTPRDDQLAIGTWGHLAIIAYHLGRPQEAKELCLRSLEFYDKWGTKGYLATLKYRLALAEEALGEFEAAKTHVDEALYWFNHLGMKPDIPAAMELKQRLEFR